MIHEKIAAVQKALKAPKSQKNSFGGYNYRSCEDILEAVKPHLTANKLALYLSDDIREVGGRIYVEATATCIDTEDGQSVSVRACAREEESKKGMDTSQITGAASSYARKYALNGLFAIDDTRDSDATNTHGREEPKAPKTPLPSCERCGNTILPVPKKGGGEMSSEDLVALSLRDYGKRLCSDCYKRIRNESKDR